MKKIMFLVVSSLLLFSAAASAQNLNVEDEKLIVDILNDICGDTWCEGPVEIDFKSVNYNDSRAGYVIRVSTLKDASNDLAQSVINFECTINDSSVIENLTSSKDLFDDKSVEARTKLMQQIDLCIDQKLMPQLKNMI